jgi:hypothetical protein
MKAIDTLDANRLLGFASLGDRLANGVDFQDDTLGARLGAKVGDGIEPGVSIDLSKLWGFASLGDQKSVDFRDETFDGKLGAKVGTGEWAARELFDTDKIATANKIDFAKLLGFEEVGEQLSEGVDFQQEAINAKLGAKVGFESMV